MPGTADVLITVAVVGAALAVLFARRLLSARQFALVLGGLVWGAAVGALCGGGHG